MEKTCSGNKSYFFNIVDNNFQGEIVSLMRKIDDSWYEGKNSMGRLGMFPTNYVRVFSEPSSTLAGNITVKIHSEKISYDYS